MAQLIAWVRVGGALFNGYTYSENYFFDPYTQKNETKSSVGSRVKPHGVNRLFSGTSVSYSKMQQSIGSFTEFFAQPFPSTVWSTQTSKVGCPFIGPKPYGLNIPDEYWINALRIKIQDSDVNLAQAFAERKQTEKMFIDYGKRLLKAYTQVKKGNVNGVLNSLLGTSNRRYKGWKQTVKDTTGVASDTWLAYQYGIRPLINDLNGSVKEYWKVRQVQPIIRSYRFNARNGLRAGGIVSSPGSGEYYSTEHWQEAKIQAYAEFQDSAQQWDQSATRLGLTDPILLAWELIPYSFVVDWFINVGEFLQASGTFSSLKRVGIHITTTNYETTVGSQKGGTSRRSVKAKSRNFISTLPSPKIRIKDSPMSISHIVSALALIRQVRF